MLKALRTRWQDWLFRRHPPGLQPVRLRQNRVYIFLSPPGFIFSLMLWVMLAGAINYDLALAYLLVFLLAAMAMVSVFHTFRTLLGLELAPGHVEHTFAGSHARFGLRLRDTGRLARMNVRLDAGTARTAIDVPAGDEVEAVLAVPAPRRGRLAAPRVRLWTSWPIGVFRSWSYVQFDQHAFIYPSPETNAPPLPSAATGEGQTRSLPRGQDDFAGLRDYVPGDPLHQVAWRATAHTGQMRVKCFSGEAGEALWLDWDQLHGLETEAALSRLCAWVLDAESRGVPYGLRLPGFTLPPAVGPSQREAALAALACFGERP
jgi:uncharacterized protein (DUF58 family)